MITVIDMYVAERQGEPHCERIRMGMCVRYHHYNCS